MEAYEPNEIDRVSCEVCPYNEAHRLHTYASYRTHLVSCKDQTFSGVSRYRCPFDYCHIYTCTEKLKWHVPRCESHPKRKEEIRQLEDVPFGQAPGKMEYQFCPYYPYHGIRIHPHDPDETQRLFTLHLQTCPRRTKPFRKEVIQDTVPLTPLKPVDSAPVSHPEITTEMQERIARERVIMYYKDKGFAVRKVLEKTQEMEEKTLYIDAIIGYNSGQFPGLGRVSAERGRYLVCRLHPDPLDKASNQAFYGLYGGLESHQTNKIAIIYQFAGAKDQIYLVIHPSEPSGFGKVLNKGELGLFRLQHSELLGVPSVLYQATHRCELLAYQEVQLTSEINEKNKLIAALQQEKCTHLTNSMQKEREMKEELERQRLEKRQKLAELQELETQIANSLENMREKSEMDLKLLSNRYNEEINSLNAEVEAAKREKSIALLNKGQLEQISESVSETLKSITLKLKSCEAQKTELQRKHEGLLLSRPKEKQGEVLVCRNCGEFQLNTVYWPCGHMYYCNVCLATLKIPLGSSIKHIRREDRVCPVCGEESTRVVPAFP